MKYKIGDKVRIRKDLVVNNTYGDDAYTKGMDDIAELNNYVLTIRAFNYDNTKYVMADDEDSYYWTDEMIEGLYEPTDREKTDREKFEGWMTKLAVIDGCTDDNVFDAFDRIVGYYSLKNHKAGDHTLEEDIDTLWEYINRPEAKRMTKAEIEEALGYKIEIVEE